MSVRLVLDESLFDRGEDTIVIDVLGRTVGECLDYAFARQPELRDVVFRGDGQFRTHVYAGVNKKYIYPEVPAQVLSEPVKEGDEVDISYASGG